MSYFKFLLLAFCQCNRQLFARKLDVVHIHNMPNFLVLAGLLPRLCGKKMILDVHDSTPETFFARYGEKANKLLFKLLCWEEAFCCGLANKVICVNHVQRDELVERGIPSKKIAISMNVPDPKWFGMNSKPLAGKSGKNIKMIYHGTIAKRLGIDLAIRAFARICPKASEIEFHILGTGEGIELIKILKYTPTAVEPGSSDLPDAFTLFANYPNPFNLSTTICYSLPASADIRLSIYNLKGEKVRTLIHQHQSAGTFEISWNGRNDNNVHVPSGIYIYSMEINTGREIKSQSHHMLLFR